MMNRQVSLLLSPVNNKWKEIFIDLRFTISTQNVETMSVINTNFGIIWQVLIHRMFKFVPPRF